MPQAAANAGRRGKIRGIDPATRPNRIPNEHVPIEKGTQLSCLRQTNFIQSTVFQRHRRKRSARPWNDRLETVKGSPDVFEWFHHLKKGDAKCDGFVTDIML